MTDYDDELERGEQLAAESERRRELEREQRAVRPVVLPDGGDEETRTCAECGEEKPASEVEDVPHYYEETEVVEPDHRHPQDPAYNPKTRTHTRAYPVPMCWDCREDEFEDPELVADGGVEGVDARWTLPSDHSYGRPVPRGPWHVYDSNARRTLCGRYNDDGIQYRDTDAGIPGSLCGGCVDEADYLERDEEATVEVRGAEVPKQLAEFYRDDLSGLIAVEPDTEGVLVYESASRVGGRPAVEIPHADPHLVDESDVPGGTTPPMSFSELVRKYGLAFEVVDDYTYVYVPEEGA